MTVDLLLYGIAFILLVLAAFGVGFGRVAFGWLGAAVVVLTVFLLPHLT